MEFRVLSYEDCDQVRQWRNKSLFALRTQYMLTEQQQAEFYSSTVCNRNANARYWGIWADNRFIGMCGIENIEWENSRCEISIIIGQEYQKSGYGMQAVKMLLTQGFNYLGLNSIWGVCYMSNPAYQFWMQVTEKYKGHEAKLTDMKYWDGVYWDGYHFTILKEGFSNE